MRRRNALFAGLLTVVLLCGITARAAFADVPEGAWYAEAVNWCREHGVVNDGTAFQPETVMTRAMVATALYRASGAPDVSAPAREFTDTSNNAAIAWAAETGVVNGYDDGTFKPDNPVTRQQFAAMLWRSAGSPAADNGTDYADETSISSYAKTAVDWARDTGVILGKDGNRFDPHGGATRAQAAVILYRYLTRSEPEEKPEADAPQSPEESEQKILVAYFSATGTTKGIAATITDILGADSYEIAPAVPYTSSDLNYNNSSSRATVEQNDASARPAIAGSVANMEQYKVVFLGYPIWWGQAPRIVSTFLESYDFAGKTIVPFCTSGSSPIGDSATNLQSLASGAAWEAGRRFAAGSSRDSVKEWTDSLNLPLNAQSASAEANQDADGETDAPKVYFTADISPESLVKVYEALNWTPTGKVAVKLSTGEPPNSNYLRPELIGDLVKAVNGTIVECNTAYGGSRSSAAMHKQVAKDHGFTAIADFDLMDEDGEKEIPVTDGVRLNRAIVGSHIDNYDSFLILSHFKGHAMAGFGGAIKNVAIGMSSASGKVLVHTAGERTTGSIWYNNQDAWLEALPEMVTAVRDYVGAENIVYVNVMNRLSVDCDCDGNPAESDMHDIGVLASYDPVALDQACVDLVYAASDSASLQARMERQHGIHALEHGAEIGLGSRTYELVTLGGNAQ